MPGHPPAEVFVRKSSSLQRTLPQTFSVADLLEWYRGGLIDLNPVFQRRSVWKPLAKSFLIDTVLRGLPVPAIILRERPTDLKTLKRAREVVDGQQRLRTLFSFILPENDEFSEDAFLISAAHQPEFAKFGFSDLPRTSQTAILEFKLHTSVLPPTTTDREVLDIFSRLNATGTKLKDQELRNAEYYGFFKTISYNLAAEYLEFWLSRGLFTADSVSRMVEVQFTSELLGVLLEGPDGLSQKYLNKLYKDNDDNEKFAKRAPVEFRRLIDFLDKHFPWDELPVFARTSMFYPLYCVVAAAMPKGPTAKNWSTSTQWKHTLTHAKRIQNDKVPAHVRESIGSQPTNRRERETLITFLTKGE